MDTAVLANVIGFAAAGIGTVMFLPQAIRCWKTKETKDISFLSYFLLAIGSLLWATYGILMIALPIIFVNSIIFFISIFLLVLKKKYG